LKYLSVFLGNSGEPRLGEGSYTVLEDDELFEVGDVLLEFGELLEFKVTLPGVRDIPLIGLVDVLFFVLFGDVLLEITGLLEEPEAFKALKMLISSGAVFDVVDEERLEVLDALLEALKRLISSGAVFEVVEVVERLEMLDVLLEGRDDLLSSESLEEGEVVISKDTCLPIRPKEGGG
jgi:hypothetical protein